MIGPDFLRERGEMDHGGRRARRTLVALLAALIAMLVLGLAALACATAAGCSSSKHASETTPRPNPPNRQTTHQRPIPIGVVERTVGSLSQPLQDAAAARSGTGALLLGGLDAADTSVSDIRFVSTRGDSLRGSLPGVRHDAAAVSLGGSAYVFGGGNGPSQLDEILQVGRGGR